MTLGPETVDAEEHERPPQELAAIRENEPVLCLADIQGNVLPGFNKDYQAFLFLRMPDSDACLPNIGRWIKAITPFVATAAQVQAFKLAYKPVEESEKDADPELRQQKPRTVQATWLNIAFSAEGLARLVPDVDRFEDVAFRAGLAQRSPLLGDPLDPGAEGHPENWVVGGPKNPAQIVLIVASDDRDDLHQEVSWLQDSLRRFATGLETAWLQEAAVLDPPMTRNEHFGFRDGISQPGVRGKLSEAPGELFTPSQARTAEDAPDLSKGKPGQDLVWPGEFVFGYVRQAGIDGPDIVEPSRERFCPGPSWARNGSYLVIRRLRQDVRAFRSFFDAKGGQDGLPDSPTLQAKSVGRRASGAPLLAVGEHGGKPLGELKPDDDKLADDDLRNNDFEFGDRDPKGLACPFIGHIRRVYTRDDKSTSLADQEDPLLRERNTSELTTQTHRMLRRGIPYGAAFDPNEVDADVTKLGGRGLMFVSYQSRIAHQFEFVTRAIVNNPRFRITHGGVDPNYDPGYDPIIGQNNSAPNRERTFTFPIDENHTRTISTEDDWVIPTGGGYFFAPSLSALKNEIAR